MIRRDQRLGVLHHLWSGGITFQCVRQVVLRDCPVGIATHHLVRRPERRVHDEFLGERHLHTGWEHATLPRHAIRADATQIEFDDRLTQLGATEQGGERERCLAADRQMCRHRCDRRRGQ